MNYAFNNYPQFDLGIPDQFRIDIWKQDFANDVAAGTVPQFSIMWISSDQTGGPPTADAMQADNDLALGRFVEIISHSPVWSSSAVFVEEDDAQNAASTTSTVTAARATSSAHTSSRMDSPTPFTTRKST